MNPQAENLLMMFIRDVCRNQSGRPSKETALAMMKYVASDPELQRLANIGDYNAILKYRRPSC